MVSMARSIAALFTTYCIVTAHPPPGESVPLASFTATRSAGVSSLITPSPATLEVLTLDCVSRSSMISATATLGVSLRCGSFMLTGSTSSSAVPV